MRHLVDIYVPEAHDARQQGREAKLPVVVAVMGGAWVIGHRWWNAPLGMRLADAGVLVVAVDYHNFPFAGVPEMVEDVRQAVQWVYDNISAYGGDASNVAMLGQSAGAHLSAMFLLEQGMKEAHAHSRGHAVPPGHRSVGSLKGFLGISGAYDLVALDAHLGSLGLSSFLPLLCGGCSAAKYSPTQLLKTPQWRALAERAFVRLPRVHLIHGERDRTVPAASSADFAAELQAAGLCAATVDVMPGTGHTGPIIEGPMRGRDDQVHAVLQLLLGDQGLERLHSLPSRRAWLFRFMIDFAERICPF